jgi:hypothetical protein
VAIDVNVRRIGLVGSAGLHASANRHIPAAARVPPPRGDTPWAIVLPLVVGR